MRKIILLLFLPFAFGCMKDDKPYEATWISLKEVDGSYVVSNFPSLLDEGKTKSPRIIKIHGNKLIDISPIASDAAYTFNKAEKMDNGVYFFRVGNRYAFQWFDKDRHIAKWTDFALKSSGLYIDSLRNTFPIVDFEWPGDKEAYESTWMKLTKVGDSYVVYNYPSREDEKNKSPVMVKINGNELTKVNYGYKPFVNIYDLDKIDSAVIFYQKNDNKTDRYSFQWFDKEKHIARWRVYNNRDSLLNENLDLYVDSLHNTFPIVDYEWKSDEDNGGKASFSDNGEKAPYESTWMELTKVGDSYVVYNFPSLIEEDKTKSPRIIKIHENQLSMVYPGYDGGYASSSFVVEKGDKDFYFFMGQEINQTNFSFQWFDREKHIARWKEYDGFNRTNDGLYVDSLHNTFPIVDYEWKDEPIDEALD